MSNNPTVTLTFAGDESRLTRSFDSVGASAKKAGEDVGAASRSMGEGFDHAAEGFDRAEQRAMGFRDTITGVQDSVGGFSKVLKGDFSGDALFQAGAGIGDLASGFSNFLIPAMKHAITWLGTTRVGMGLATAAQWAWNAAISANPIGLIIIAIVALVGVFILLWNKCDWFRDLWKGLWHDIQGFAGGFIDWFKSIPDLLKSAFSGLVNIIVWPYRTAFNLISDAWNHTIGKLHWTVPSWVPGIGGNTVGAPQLPRFHGGASRVPGMAGDEVMAILQAGEQVTPAGASSAPAAAPFRRSGRRVEDLVLELVAIALQGQGLRIVNA